MGPPPRTIKKLNIQTKSRDSRVVVGADPYKIVQNSDIVSTRPVVTSAPQAPRENEIKTKNKTI